MSDGLKAIAAAILVSAPSSLFETDREMFLPAETPVFDFARQHYRQYRTLPTATTVQEETGVRLPIAPEPLAFYLDRIYERHEYNQIRALFGPLREGLSQLNMAAVTESVASMHQVTRARHRRGNEVMNIAEAFSLVTDRLERTRGYGGVTGIETGWPTYDETTGGYQRGDLISLVGRPEVGKTYLLLRQAWHAHLIGGHSVLFITTEMGAEQLARRHASIATGINPYYLKTNQVSSHMERRLREFYRDMRGVDNFRIFSVGMRSQVSGIEAMVQEFGPDIVYIDGPHLLNTSLVGKNANRTERITGVFDVLKALTLEVDRPFVVATHLNRTSGKGGAEASLENISYADAIGTHSSLAVALQFGPTANPRDSRWLKFLKGREGESGQIAINFKFAPLDMDEMPDGGAASRPEAAASRAASVDWME